MSRPGVGRSGWSGAAEAQIRAERDGRSLPPSRPRSQAPWFDSGPPRESYSSGMPETTRIEIRRKIHALRVWRIDIFVEPPRGQTEEKVAALKARLKQEYDRLCAKRDALPAEPDPKPEHEPEPEPEPEPKLWDIPPGQGTQNRKWLSPSEFDSLRTARPPPLRFRQITNEVRCGGCGRWITVSHLSFAGDHFCRYCADVALGRHR